MKEKKLTTSNIGQNTNEFKWIQAPNTDMYILFLSISLTLLFWCLAVLFCFENLCATFIRLGCDMFHTIRNICSHLSHIFFSFEFSMFRSPHRQFPISDSLIRTIFGETRFFLHWNSEHKSNVYEDMQTIQSMNCLSPWFFHLLNTLAREKKNEIL